MDSSTSGPDLPPLERALGLTLSSARLAEVRAPCAPVLLEIERLRELDLRDAHPTVVYEPAAPYQRSPNTSTEKRVRTFPAQRERTGA